MTSPEQRRFPRKPIAVVFTAKDAQGQGQLSFEGMDLSRGGAFLRSDLLLEQEEALVLEFQLPTLSRPLKAQARVAWVRRFPKENESPGMGVAFLAMTDQDRDALEAYLRSVAAQGGP